jgi:hypothetical protein
MNARVPSCTYLAPCFSLLPRFEAARIGLAEGAECGENVSQELSHSFRRMAMVALPSFSRFRALFNASIVSAISACCEGIVVAVADDLAGEGEARSSARRNKELLRSLEDLSCSNSWGPVETSHGH